MGAYESAVAYTVEKMISAFNCNFHGFNIPRENGNVWTKIIEYECIEDYQAFKSSKKFIKGQIYKLNIEPDQLGYTLNPANFKLVDEYVELRK